MGGLQGIGHELNNVIDEAEWFGPYTELQAERLAASLNKLLADPDNVEHPIASTMPLDSASPREVIRKIKQSL